MGSAETVPHELAALARATEPKNFASAAALLQKAASSSPDNALSLLRQALPILESMPSTFRRRAWLLSYGSPLLRRKHHFKLLRHLAGHQGGITRSVSGLPMPTGVALLLRHCTPFPVGSAVPAGNEVEALDGFATLCWPADSAQAGMDAALAAVDLWYQFREDPEPEALRYATQGIRNPQLLWAADLAAWFSALVRPDPRTCTRLIPTNQCDPEGIGVRALLSLPILRGVRRRGARSHGDRLAKEIEAALAARGGGLGAVDIGLPPVLLASPSIRDLVAPLVLDAIGCVVGHLGRGRGTLAGCATLERRCPRLLRDARQIVEGLAAVPLHSEESTGPMEDARVVFQALGLRYSDMPEDQASDPPDRCE